MLTQITGARKTNKNAKKSPLILISTKSRLVSDEMGLLVDESILSRVRFFHHRKPHVKIKSDLIESTFFD